MEGDRVVKKGYLFIKRPPRSCWQKPKVWHRRYFVLRDETGHDGPLLEMYREKDPIWPGWRRPQTRLNLSGSPHLGYRLDSSKFPLALVLVCQGKAPLTLAADNELATRAWLLALGLVTRQDVLLARGADDFVEHSSRDSSCNAWPSSPTAARGKDEPTCRLGSPFQATVEPTEDSEKSGLRGEVLLVVCRHGVGVAGAGEARCFLRWPVAYLKQFRHQNLSGGWSRSTVVVLEFGRRCSKGEGVFRFKTQKGRELVAQLKTMVDSWSARKASSGRHRSKQEARSAGDSEAKTSPKKPRPEGALPAAPPPSPSDRRSSPGPHEEVKKPFLSVGPERRTSDRREEKRADRDEAEDEGYVEELLARQDPAEERDHAPRQRNRPGRAKILSFR